MPASKLKKNPNITNQLTTRRRLWIKGEKGRRDEKKLFPYSKRRLFALASRRSSPFVVDVRLFFSFFLFWKTRLRYNTKQERFKSLAFDNWTPKLSERWPCVKNRASYAREKEREKKIDDYLQPSISFERVKPLFRFFEARVAVIRFGGRQWRCRRRVYRWRNL